MHVFIAEYHHTYDIINSKLFADLGDAIQYAKDRLLEDANIEPSMWWEPEPKPIEWDVRTIGDITEVYCWSAHAHFIIERQTLIPKIITVQESFPPALNINVEISPRPMRDHRVKLLAQEYIGLHQIDGGRHYRAWNPHKRSGRTAKHRVVKAIKNNERQSFRNQIRMEHGYAA